MNRRLRRMRGRMQRARFLAPAYVAAAVLRPRSVGVRSDIVRETWDAVADGAHNSNTDLTEFDGWLYLCHQTSPYHLGSRKSRLLLWRSRFLHWRFQRLQIWRGKRPASWQSFSRRAMMQPRR